jgi:hypothetical protein
MQGSDVDSGNPGKFADIPNAFTGQEKSEMLDFRVGLGNL